MPYNTLERARVYDRTAGRCHLCRKKLARTNYAQSGRPSAQCLVARLVPRSVHLSETGLDVKRTAGDL